MTMTRRRWLFFVGLLLISMTAGTYFIIQHYRYQAMHTLPEGLTRFDVNGPPPVCGRWKDHMPKTRDPEIYRPYIAARKLWRGKIEWQLTRVEAMRILDAVHTAAVKGDWGARSLMATFYREGLGPLPSNNVLDPDPMKAMQLVRLGVEAGQPWAFYDLGVGYERGDAGLPYDVDIAWAYYLKAAEMGSPEAQMALAEAYSKARRLDAQLTMLQCAYQQGHGEAAYTLGIREKIYGRYQEAIKLRQDGAKFGSHHSAGSLWLLFDDGYWGNSDMEERQTLKALGIEADPERAQRYKTIKEALQINPDLRLTRLDQVLPLPPAKLPPWNGIEDAIEPEPWPPTY